MKDMNLIQLLRSVICNLEDFIVFNYLLKKISNFRKYYITHRVSLFCMLIEFVKIYTEYLFTRIFQG